jgi:crotonobetainyl-CoA:carnitine CoA-transferase CaiB-like acyl-CoA transferase
MALAMGDIITLSGLLECEQLKTFTDPASWFNQRDEIKTILANHLAGRSTQDWLSVLEPADIWCARVLDYDRLVKEKGYTVLNMEIKVKTSNGLSVTTTRCPIRMDGKLFISEKGAPLLGEHNEAIEEQFGLVGSRKSAKVSKV